MRLLFLVPFTVALVSGYILSNSGQEISYLMGAVSVIGILLSLILAPWQLQLVILVVAIISARLFWLRFQELETNEQTQESEYSSGEKTNPSEAAAMGETDEIIGRYRGAPIVVKKTPTNIAYKPSSGLKYRGVTLDNSEIDQS